MYIYYCHDYEKCVVIDLNEELSQGEHSYFLGSLFPYDGNQPPEKPSPPYCNDELIITGEIYRFFCKYINDPNGDKISYCFDWGDETQSQWITSHSGIASTASASHSWTERGTYSVRVKARDEFGAESEWSDPLSINIPKSKPYFNSLINDFLENHTNMFPLIRLILGL